MINMIIIVGIDRRGILYLIIVNYDYLLVIY